MYVNQTILNYNYNYIEKCINRKINLDFKKYKTGENLNDRFSI